MKRFPKFHSIRCRSLSISTKLSSLSNETRAIPSRASMLGDLRSGEEFDLLIIGGGSTGSGAALDATARGLRVALVEREDFSSGTSSRSTKLIWGGSRYLVQALVNLMNLDMRLLKSPRRTIIRFWDEFKMVLNCHRERKFLLEKQPHLTSWLPIAVPLTKWIISPPPFGYPPASLGPLGLFPLFFKFYDALSGFSSPPSHIMTRKRARRKFPQLRVSEMIYCPIFYEGQHDDSRTNLAIAQTAAKRGACIVNYCNVTALLRGNSLSAQKNSSDRITGATIKDELSGEFFNVNAKSVLLCGGPFTDEIRHLEDPAAKKAINGASGIHIVLPSYYAPSSIGLVDMSTSDGRFLFFLPWQGHVVVGTTDRKCDPSMRPEAEEDEIRWVLTEASKYLSPELRVRRQDVLSAWSGVRPLAIDPHATGTASASRDHVISHNPSSGVVFISGGKWTTYREMAQDAIDKVLHVTPALKRPDRPLQPCSTLDISLVGKEGWSNNLHIRLAQDYGVASSVAARLAQAYGGRAADVLAIAAELEGKTGAINKRGRRLVTGYPYIEAEVVFACRHDWAVRAIDIIARRTRLAFLNKEKAIESISRVVELMGDELKWDDATRRAERKHCLEYLHHFGGSIPKKQVSEHQSRRDTLDDIRDAFERAGAVVTGMGRGAALRLDADAIQMAARILSKPLSEAELSECLSSSPAADGKVDFEEFAKFWNQGALEMPDFAVLGTDKVSPGVMFG